jgi:uncharacterized protein YbaP (TraB family)
VKQLISLSVFIFFYLFATAQQSQQSSLLWKISGNGLSKDSYLYGTMHLRDKRLFSFSDSLYRFMEQSDAFAMEILPDSMMGDLLDFDELLSGPVEAQQNLVTENEYEAITRVLNKELGFGMKNFNFRMTDIIRKLLKVKPVKNTDMPTFMDAYLMNVFKKQGKKVYGLETKKDYEYLLNPTAITYDLIEAEPVAPPKKRLTSDQMIEIYLDQDIGAMQDFFDGINQNYRKELLDVRNRKMVLRIDSLARIGSTFFTMGAGHLGGSNGVVSLLTAMGYTLSPVRSEEKVHASGYHYEPRETLFFPLDVTERGYKVAMPGKAWPVQGLNGSLLMNMYADFGTGTTYLSADINLPGTVNAEDRDSILDKAADNLLGYEGTYISRDAVHNGNNEGREYLVKNSERSWLRARLFLSGRRIFMAIAAAEHEWILKSIDTQRFLESLDIGRPQPLVPTTVTSEKGAFRVHFPGKPGNPELLSEAIRRRGVHVTTVPDLEKNLVYYARYIDRDEAGSKTDSAAMADLEEPLRQESVREVFSENFSYRGYPARRSSYQFRDNTMLRSVHITRGNRTYSLMLAGDATAMDSATTEDFFGSFELLPFKKANWTLRLSKDSVFSTWSPDTIPVTSFEEEFSEVLDSAAIATLEKTLEGEGEMLMKDRTYAVTDSNMAVTYDIKSEDLGKYFWIENDSAFFRERCETYKEEGDSLVSYRRVSNGASRGAEFVFSTPGTSVVKRYRLLLNGRGLLCIKASIPLRETSDPDVNRFFEDFRFREEINIDLTKNRSGEILDNLISEDQEVFNQAFSQLESAPFSKSDLPALYKAAVKKYVLEGTYSSANSVVMSRIGQLADRSVVDFVKNNYEAARENGELQALMIRLLASYHTADSYALMKQLVLQSPPATEYLDIGYELEDSLQLTRTLFPEIMSLRDKSSEQFPLAGVTLTLLDSGLLAPADIAPYRESIVESAGPVLELGKEALTEEGYAYTGVIGLLGYLDDEKSGDILEALTVKKARFLRYIAAIALVKRNTGIRSSLLEAIAADPEYRAEFYTDLENLGRESLFPAQYKTRRLLAESRLYMKLYDFEAESVPELEFIGEEVIEYKGIPKHFYLFQVKNQGYKGSVNLGISGPYSDDPADLASDDTLTGMHYDVWIREETRKQLEAYLKDL